MIQHKRKAVLFKKRFGQHFLTDPNIARKIVDFACIEKECVLEIGAGKGMLTLEIAKKAEMVYAVEIDPRFIEILRQKCPSNVVVINQDFLKLDLRDYSNCIIVGNIPYSITTPILEKFVQMRTFFRRAVLTMQKEYGERLLATSGSKFYGSVTIYANYYFEIQKGFIIPPRFFLPRPKVSSMVISLNKKSPPFVVDREQEFFKFVRGIFQYRRKKLKNCLRNYLGYVPEGIDPVILKKRPDDLGPLDFKYLYELQIRKNI